MDEVETAAADTTSDAFLSRPPLHSDLNSLAFRDHVDDSLHGLKGLNHLQSETQKPVGVARPLQQYTQDKDISHNNPYFEPALSDKELSMSSEGGGVWEGGGDNSAKRMKLIDEEKSEVRGSEDGLSTFLGLDDLNVSTSSSENEQYQFTPPSYLAQDRAEEEDIAVFLPAGKKWHMFVSHSTSDVELVKNVIIEQYEDSTRRVCASCSFMTKDQVYVNTDIKSAMNESCVIMVAISEPYINSGRLHLLRPHSRNGSFNVCPHVGVERSGSMLCPSLVSRSVMWLLLQLPYAQDQLL